MNVYAPFRFKNARRQNKSNGESAYASCYQLYTSNLVTGVVVDFDVIDIDDNFRVNIFDDLVSRHIVKRAAIEFMTCQDVNGSAIRRAPISPPLLLMIELCLVAKDDT